MLQHWLILKNSECNFFSSQWIFFLTQKVIIQVFYCKRVRIMLNGGAEKKQIYHKAQHAPRGLKYVSLIDFTLWKSIGRAWCINSQRKYNKNLCLNQIKSQHWWRNRKILKENLLSIGQMMERGYTLHIEWGVWKILDNKRAKIS